MSDTQQTNIAIAHWAESCNGGGERVGWELARTFDEPVWVGSRDASIEPDDVDVRELFDGRWARRLINRGGLSQMAAYAYLWQSHADALAEADVVVTSGNEPLFYVPDGEQPWIAYVHHTGRHQTDLLRDRWGDGIKDTIARVVMWGQRMVMDKNASKPDRMVANSEPVARRINRYWGVPKSKISVVYPPVPVETYGRDQAPTEDYYLSLCRLDWHKRIGEIVDAFRGRDDHLIVAGDGDERAALEQRAPPNVEFVGYVSEQRKRELFSGAKATITNALAEDFGLTTVEPLASGTPVLGVAEGMTQHLVADGRNGITYERGQLGDALDRFEREGVEWSPGRIEDFAERFRTERFRTEMREVVDAVATDAAASHRPAWVDDLKTLAAADGGPDA